jgi:hypothetical protein
VAKEILLAKDEEPLQKAKYLGETKSCVGYYVDFALNYMYIYIANCNISGCCTLNLLTMLIRMVAFFLVACT